MCPTGAGGRIVNVATRPALEWRVGAGMAAYTASKAAVAALTVALAEEVVKADILVNAIAPSTMDTAANRKAMPKADFSAWTKVEDVARDHPVPGLARKPRHPRRHRAGLRTKLSRRMTADTPCGGGIPQGRTMAAPDANYRSLLISMN